MLTSSRPASMRAKASTVSMSCEVTSARVDAEHLLLLAVIERATDAFGEEIGVAEDGVERSSQLVRHAKLLPRVRRGGLRR
jgi:hypothetical protein